MKINEWAIVQLWDVSSDIASQSSDIFHLVFNQVQAAFVVVDAGSKTSLIDADNWIKLLFANNVPSDKITLLINKADSPELVVNQDMLCTFVSLGGCREWYWTVSHERFRDYCPSRGPTLHCHDGTLTNLPF